MSCIFVFTSDVLGTIGTATPINYASLEPILPPDTVDQLEKECLNIIKVRKEFSFDCLFEKGITDSSRYLISRRR